MRAVLVIKDRYIGGDAGLSGRVHHRIVGNQSATGTIDRNTMVLVG